jgi:hypothetical protein
MGGPGLRLLALLIVGWMAGGPESANALQLEQIPYKGSHVAWLTQSDLVSMGAVVSSDWFADGSGLHAIEPRQFFPHGLQPKTE